MTDYETWLAGRFLDPTVAGWHRKTSARGRNITDDVVRPRQPSPPEPESTVKPVMARREDAPEPDRCICGLTFTSRHGLANHINRRGKSHARAEQLTD